ncbi:protein kinase [Pyrenochaeta sp. DS3sAY3a]|nr:protein kinase [Pyrenochaeta sp. DS3sAY3a]
MSDRNLIRSFPTTGFGRVSLEDKFDEEGLPRYHAERFYPVRIGDVYNDRYQILAKLGFGTTSTIWLCRDLRQNDFLTMKVCAPEETSDSGVNNELSVSQYLDSIEAEHPGKNFLRLIIDHFLLQGSVGKHQCLLFTPLGLNFTQLRNRFPEKSVPKLLVQHTMQILLIGFDFLHQVGIVHTDISPNNLLLGLTDMAAFSEIERSELENPSYRKQLPDQTIHMSHKMPVTEGMPKICDFGAARIGAEHTGDVMPGQYRAPEVILEMKWDSKIDIWAIALTTWDLLQGNYLFNASKDGLLHDERHLAEMVSLMGSPPKEFLERSENCRKYWDREGNWIAQTPIPNQSLETRNKHFSGEDGQHLLQFMRKIVRWLPEERPTAEDLYKDAFISQNRIGSTRDVETAPST